MAADKSKQPDKVLAKSVHLGLGVDLLGSKMSLQAKAGNELEVTALGIKATGKSGRIVLVPWANIKGVELQGTVEAEAKDKARQEAIDIANEQRRNAVHVPGTRAIPKPKTEPVPEEVSLEAQEAAIKQAAEARALARAKAKAESEEKMKADERKGIRVQRQR